MENDTRCNQLFHEGEAAASVREGKRSKNSDERGSTGGDADYLSKLCKLLAKMELNDQKLLRHVAQKVAKRS
ncbi:MAG TPA: hypothetical protein VNO32_56895 [Candidatus Acidoferrum sp.]|nr:hypothetical protein [Candidatus Acidoferrum sp.]